MNNRDANTEKPPEIIENNIMKYHFAWAFVCVMLWRASRQSDVFDLIFQIEDESCLHAFSVFVYTQAKSTDEDKKWHF